MSLQTKANSVLRHARELASSAKTWADFSAALFDQSSGVIAKTFPDQLERQLFQDTEQSKEVNALLLDVIRRSGVVAGAERTEKSGKFVVRVPKTIHHKLEIEAKREGVSLNQLAVSKLTLPLPSATGLGGELIVQAFNSVHDGFSQDWVIVHPEYNERFLAKCRELGLTTHPARVLNHTLMNIRKNPKNKGRLNPTTKRSGFNDYDDYAFAAEIAVRVLQRTEGVTLDRILCDPDLRIRYDQLALRLATDQTILKVRCAALNLRKTHRLQPIAEDVVDYELQSAGPIQSVNLNAIAADPGGYVFYDERRPIFAGQTDNLQKRIGHHLKYGMPDWLGIGSEERLVLKVVPISGRREERLNWLGTFINVEKPLLNYQRAA